MRAVVALGIAVLAGCSDIVSFDVDQDVPEQTVMGSPLPGPLAALFPVPLEIDIQGKIAAMETGPIDRISMKSLRLEITTDADDWAFLDGIDLYVESTKAGTTLARVKVATAGAPGAVTVLTLTPVGGVNLLPYVNEGAQLTADAMGSLPPDDVSYDGLAVFHVEPL
jgi:hypothetical protein